MVWIKRCRLFIHTSPSDRVLQSYWVIVLEGLKSHESRFLWHGKEIINRANALFLTGVNKTATNSGITRRGSREVSVHVRCLIFSHDYCFFMLTIVILFECCSNATKHEIVNKTYSLNFWTNCVRTNNSPKAN